VIGEMGGSRLITQRSEVQILPPLRRIALRRRPFLDERAFRMMRCVTKVVVNEASAAVTRRDGWDALRRDKSPDTRSLGG
jgi:hypothetical protein